MAGEEAAGILKATLFAANKHANQRRKDSTSTPYINHPIGVAEVIARVGGVSNVHILQAALLHDTIEDTQTTPEEIEKIFGVEVRDLVNEVTDDRKLTRVERKRAQVEKGPHKSYGAKVVKLADKLNNLTDLIRDPPPSWNVFYIQGYFVWGKKVVDGLRGTNAPLEAALDEVFKQRFVKSGTEYPAIPNADLDGFLLEYYESIEQGK